MQAPRVLGLRVPRCFWSHEPPRSILQLVPSKASFCFCRFFVFFLNGAPKRIAKTHDLKPGCIRRRLPTIMQAACRTNCGIAGIHTLILSTDVQILRSRMSELTINSKPPGVEIVSSNPHLPHPKPLTPGSWTLPRPEPPSHALEDDVHCLRLVDIAPSRPTMASGGVWG